MLLRSSWPDLTCVSPFDDLWDLPDTSLELGERGACGTRSLCDLTVINIFLTRRQTTDSSSSLSLFLATPIRCRSSLRYNHTISKPNRGHELLLVSSFQLFIFLKGVNSSNDNSRGDTCCRFSRRYISYLLGAKRRWFENLCPLGPVNEC